MKQLSIFDVLEAPNESIEKLISKIKNPEKRYLTEEHFDVAVTNPNFISYLLANGKQVGDEYRLYEMQIWINQKVVEFKKSHGRRKHDMLNQIEGWPEKLRVFLRGG